MTLKSQEALFEFGQRGDVVWVRTFPCTTEEINLHFDLAIIAGVNRCVDKDEVGPLRFQPINGLLTTMG